jgi:large subunit ribosomal protein L10
MNRDQKAAVVEEVAGQIQEAEAIFAVDYRGISVSQVAELRARLSEADATLRVVKNTLTERAVEKAGAESLKELLEGPTAFTFVHGDAALAAKAIATFRRENNVPEFKGGTMNGAALTIDELEAISRLPGRDALDAQFVGVLAAPITGLVRGLNQLIQGLALQLGQIADQRLVSGEAAEEPAAADAVREPVDEASADETPAEGAASEDQASPETDEALAEAEEAPAAAEEAPAAAEEADDAPPTEEAPAGDEGNAPTESEDPTAESEKPAAEGDDTAAESEEPADEGAPPDETSGDAPAENEENEAPSEGDEEESNRAQPAEPAASPEQKEG